MRLWFLQLWDRLRTSYWFVPTLMAATAVVLALLLVPLDRALEDTSVERWWLAYTGGPEGARAVLSVIAGSMITVAGLVFSITIVTLTLASSQFGPRLLRNFIRDSANQVVLGTFVATYLYCLLVLRTVRSTDGESFVPHIAVAVGVLLAVVSLGVLIYFIHHVAVAIQATHIVTDVSSELLIAIDAMFPEARDDAAHKAPAIPAQEMLPAEFFEKGRVVAATKNGYLQLLDYDRLVSLASEHDLVVETCFRPGQFIVLGQAMARVACDERVEDRLIELIQKAFVLGHQPTPTQDPEFAVRQLVEIALRALSPGINDPFTAMSCLDWLGAALGRLAQRTIPSTHRYDEDRRLRVVGPVVGFSGMADAAFNQFRQAARTNAAVTIRLLETITTVADRTQRREDLQVLAHHGLLVWRSSQTGLAEESDRQDAEERYHRLERCIADNGSARTST